VLTGPCASIALCVLAETAGRGPTVFIFECGPDLFFQPVRVSGWLSGWAAPTLQENVSKQIKIQVLYKLCETNNGNQSCHHKSLKLIFMCILEPRLFTGPFITGPWETLQKIP